jgi:hypothetical protein
VPVAPLDPKWAEKMANHVFVGLLKSRPAKRR